MSGLEFEPLSHSYYVDGVKVPSVTEVIKPLEAYYRMSETMLRPYADRGTAVHALTEVYDAGDLEGASKAAQQRWASRVDPKLAGYLKAWVDFRSDFRFEPVAVEHRVYHSAHQYAGTIDRAGFVRGRASIVDIKTSAKLGPAIGVQLAGYLEAWNRECEPEHMAESRYAVQLMGDGTYRVVEYADPADWQVFLGCLALHHWQEKHRKTIRIGDVRPRVDNERIDSNWPVLTGTATRSI